MASSNETCLTSVEMQAADDVLETYPLVADKLSDVESNDSDSSNGVKRIYLHDNHNESVCSSLCATDLQSNISDSVNSSSSNTRKNSIYSDSDLEVPFQSLFQLPAASSRSSVNSLGSFSSSDSALLDGLDVLLQRITSERFLELQRLEVGERPVTGGNARDSLERFFHRAVHGPSEEERQQETNRPEHVANDVSSLQQSALVQNALQNDFRQQLEDSLRIRLPTSSAPVQLNAGSFTSRQSRTLHVTPETTQVNRPTVGGLHLRSQLEGIFSNRLGSSNSSRLTDAQPRRQTVADRSLNNLTPSTPSYSSTHQRNTTDHLHTSNLQITIETGLQLLTDSITEDLTRLQSLQVVSNMLRTDFRNELEDMISDRVNDVGNGAAVQNAIQSLPRRSRATNLPPSNSTASAVLANDRHLDAEITSLRQQISEMKRMLAMSFEIQMDTQRSIRQEVAGAFSVFMQDYVSHRSSQNTGTSLGTGFQPTRSHSVSVGQCVICADRNIDTLLYQCGHMCVCHHCGLQLKMDGHNCPMCRAPIRDVVRAYQTQN